jgi:hypothetical protein
VAEGHHDGQDQRGISRLRLAQDQYPLLACARAATIASAAN